MRAREFRSKAKVGKKVIFKDGLKDGHSYGWMRFYPNMLESSRVIASTDIETEPYVVKLENGYHVTPHFLKDIV